MAGIAEANPEAEVELRAVSRALRSRDLPVIDPVVKAFLRTHQPAWLGGKPHLMELYRRIAWGRA